MRQKNFRVLRQILRATFGGGRLRVALSRRPVLLCQRLQSLLLPERAWICKWMGRL